MTAEHLLQNLNAEQREAVLHEGGPLLILAGAGSGKTRVITRRLAYLILARHVDPMRVLAITFTNKAAREMKDRVLELVPRSDLWVSTFHSMAARVLRREAAAIGYKNDFTIYDTYDRSQALRAVVRELELDEDVYKPGPLGHQISARKNRGLAPGASDPDVGHVDPNYSKIEISYAEKMKQCCAMDFDDLLLKLLELFETRPEIGERYAKRFEHVLVDEYQDTNPTQYKITAALSKGTRNLCVCGDPDQSIYAWRGADIRNILDFERDFAPVTVVRLEMNYRSTKNILAAAQGVIEHNSRRRAKVLKSDAAPGEKLSMIESVDELDEARSIVATIRSLTGGKNIKLKNGEPARLSDVAIFYRANFLQRALERGLRDAGMPYRVASGLEFFERREIKDIIAYLKLLINPSDNVAFERIINVPTRGIGATTLEKLQNEARRLGCGLYEAALDRHVRAGFAARTRNAVEAFLGLLDRLKLLIDGRAESAVAEIVYATDYLKYCGDLGDAGDVDRVENLRELEVSAREFDTREPGAGARGFLAEVALVSDTDRINGDCDRVTLMTLHSAKGLEFPIVFIAGVEDGLIPHRRAIEETSGTDGLEEERRLFFVGITRAREHLYLTRARYRTQFGQRGGLFEAETAPSRFLDEIPDHCLQWTRREDSFVFKSSGNHKSNEDSQYSQIDPGGQFGDAEAQVSDEPALQAGMRVRHARFGEGKILELRGSGANARAVVKFRSGDEKQLLLQYAHLELL
ncbi:MAG: UvrD-helicase domain-containing protein [Planctomycetes bacterium]|nr:UvrD-helicase domain-containing protein [Planctomycetota bacterium]